jgi:hypothetical protein
MFRGFFCVPLALVCTASCDKGTAPVPPEAGAAAATGAPAASAVVSAKAAAPAPSSPPASSGAAAGSGARDANDFEDLFHYGDFDAGAGDPALLSTKSAYVTYRNARFDFQVEVPRAFTAMPEPTNGDGLQWRLGNLVAMTASGMHAIPDVPLGCASSSHVTAHKETKDTCWATGVRDGYIFWQRYVVKNDVMYSLHLQYSQSLRAQMDPIVTHVNASWKF